MYKDVLGCTIYDRAQNKNKKTNKHTEELFVLNI